MTPLLPRSELQIRLRSATKAAHRALDHQPLMASLLVEGVTTVQYANALAGLHSMYEQAEKSIIDFLLKEPGLFDYAPRCKLQKLESDLAALQKTPARSTVQLQPLNSTSELIGRLYTLEGSTLGGEAIAKVLQQRGLAHLPLHFFSGYGDQTRQMWDEFISFAEVQCAPDQHEKAVLSAIDLFEAFKMHLDQVALH